MNDRPQTTPAGGAYSWGWILALAVFFAGVAGILGDRYLKCQSRTRALSSELRLLNAEWAATSGQLSEARRMQQIFKARAQHVERIGKERDAAGWVPVIQSIVKCAETGIELRDIRARGASGEAQTWSLAVGGVSKGAVPRTVADRFRVALQQELEEEFPGRVKTRFERLEELPASAPALPDERQGAFTIMVTIGVTTPAEVKSGEGV